MDESDFEGTLILEKLAEQDNVDAFFDAIDSDDFEQAAELMRNAGIDDQTIQEALKQMEDME